MYYVFDLRFVLYFSLQTRNLPYMVNEVGEYNFVVLSKNNLYVNIKIFL